MELGKYLEENIKLKEHNKFNEEYYDNKDKEAQDQLEKYRIYMN